VEFSRTPVGYLIQHLCPLEWKLLSESNIKGLITPELIDMIATASEDEFFQSEAYRLALIDYREFGLATPHKKAKSVTQEIKYAKIRREKRLKEIGKNKNPNRFTTTGRDSVE